MRFKVQLGVLSAKTETIFRVDVEVDGKEIEGKRFVIPHGEVRHRQIIIEGGGTSIREEDIPASEADR